MKHFLPLLMLICLSIPSLGQEKKDLAISFSAGYLNSPYYNNAHARPFYGFSFDYCIAKRQFLSASYLAGGHDYFDNTLSNTPASAYIVNPKGTNAKAHYISFSVAYKYKVINQEKFSLIPGAGVGMLTHARDYPYTQGASIIFHTSTWSDLVFPVTLDLQYKLSGHFQIGLTSGFLIHPDFPVLALHGGPKLSYLLK